MGEVREPRVMSGRAKGCSGGRDSRGRVDCVPDVSPGWVRRGTGVFYIVGKRLLDISVSAVVLILCLPIGLLIAAAIRLESRGGVLFLQERAGFRGRPFRMLKFRSMVRNARAERKRLAEENGSQGPVFKVRGDSRVTRVGRLLRRTSMDELPQFFNVLKGDMSLVGPRPLPVADIGHSGPLPEGISQDVIERWIAARQAACPGITGLWQIRGRSLLALDGWIRCDMEYVERQGMLLDIKILLLTPFVVLTGRGAF